MYSLIVNSKIIRGVISKVLNRAIKKNLGATAATKVNEISLSVHEGQAHLGVNIELDMTEEELGKVLAKFGL